MSQLDQADENSISGNSRHDNVNICICRILNAISQTIFGVIAVNWTIGYVRLDLVRGGNHKNW